MQLLPTLKFLFFGHAAVSAVFVSIIIFFGGLRSNLKSSSDLVPVLIETIMRFMAVSTLASMLTVQAVLARRTPPSPAFAARVAPLTGPVYGWKRQRYAVRIASSVWAMALVSQMLIFVDGMYTDNRSVRTIMSHITLVSLWKPMSYVVIPLVILPIVLSHAATTIYVFWIWPKSVVPVTVVRQVAPHAALLYRQPNVPSEDVELATPREGRDMPGQTAGVSDPRSSSGTRQ